MPWAELLAAALRLGITPAAFWRLSIAEWNMIMGASIGTGRPMTRGELETLAARFPDTSKAEI